MVGLPDIRSHSKSRLFSNPTSLRPSKSRFVWISDPLYYSKLAYPNKDFNERLKNLSINDQLDLVRVSGSDIGNGPSGLFYNVRSERKTKFRDCKKY